MTTTESSEYKIIQNNSENLIVCFGGMINSFLLSPPFEFLNFLSKTYKKNVDLYFFIDKHQSWFHKGIQGIANNIDDCALYIKNIMNKKNYKKTIFMGSSAGGYASILFGSLCNVSNVLAFIPRTRHEHRMTDPKYNSLKNVINNNTEYLFIGDSSITDKNDNHHISHCYELGDLQNVKIISYFGVHLKHLRDSGEIKKILDNILININENGLKKRNSQKIKKILINILVIIWIKEILNHYNYVIKTKMVPKSKRFFMY